MPVHREGKFNISSSRRATSAKKQKGRGVGGGGHCSLETVGTGLSRLRHVLGNYPYQTKLLLPPPSSSSPIHPLFLVLLFTRLMQSISRYVRLFVFLFVCLCHRLNSLGITNPPETLIAAA